MEFGYFKLRSRSGCSSLPNAPLIRFFLLQNIWSLFTKRVRILKFGSGCCSFCSFYSNLSVKILKLICQRFGQQPFQKINVGFQNFEWRISLGCFSQPTLLLFTIRYFLNFETNICWILKKKTFVDFLNFKLRIGLCWCRQPMLLLFTI